MSIHPLSSSKSTEDFYKTLPEFSGIDGMTNQGHYREAPDDWFVVITDVRGSTAAVAQGRYKEDRKSVV